MMIEDTLLRKYLDLAIFALNPTEQWFAHVTVAGPFARKIDIPRSREFMHQVSILGPGRFDNGQHQTIFLNVNSRDLAMHMDKPDFADAVPHITLYNGPDRTLADWLQTELLDRKLFGRFYTTEFQVVESRPQKRFDLAYSLDTSLLPQTAGLVVEDFRKLPVADRVQIALDALDAGLTQRFYARFSN